MWKTLLGLNPLREKDLSKPAMIRLRISSIFALSMTPLITLLDWRFEPMSLTLKLALIVVTVLCMCPFMFSRMGSIFTRSRNNLDEWELRARTKAQSFAFRAVTFVLILSALALNVYGFKYDLDTVSFQGETMYYVIANLVLLSLLLPVAYVAWTQKPLDDGEELEDLSDIVV